MLGRELKAIRVALLLRERAELAGEDAVIGVVDVAVDDVAGALTDFALARKISDGAHRIQVLAFEKAERVRFGNALARHNFVVDVAQRTVLEAESHVRLN